MLKRPLQVLAHAQYVIFEYSFENVFRNQPCRRILGTWACRRECHKGGDGLATSWLALGCNSGTPPTITKKATHF